MIVKSHLVVHLHEDPDHRPTEAEGPSEEYFEVVVLPSEDDEPVMVTMTENTLAHLVGCIAGFKDYTIVPVGEAP